MRKIIVSEFISLDGVVEAPGGEEGYRHSGWTFDIESDPTMYEFKSEELQEADALLLGRRTYDGFAAAWPERDGGSPTSSTPFRSNSCRPRLPTPSGTTPPSTGSTTAPARRE